VYNFLEISAQENSNKDYSPIYIMDSTYYTDTTVYLSVESYPVLITQEREYQIKELKEFIQMNLKYPENGMDCIGKVFISFIVEKDGSLSNKKYVRKLCPGFDENAMSVVDSMKKWKPGMINDESVRTMLTIPISWRVE
jgi:protein TonB